MVHSMVGLVTALIATAMLISLCRNFYCLSCKSGKKKKSKYYPAIRSSSVICLIAIAIRLFTLFLLHIPLYCPQCNISHNMAIAWQLLSAFFLFSSKPLIQIHFVIRLYYTFRGSSFASNISTYSILAGIIMTELFCIFLYFVSGLIQLRADEDSPLLVEDDFDDGNYKKAFESWFSISLLIIAIISDLIVSFSITYLFVHKLFHLLIIGIQSRHGDDLNVEIIPKPKKSTNSLQVLNDSTDSPSLSPSRSPKSTRSISTWSNSSSAFSIMHVNKIQLMQKDRQMIDTITSFVTACIFSNIPIKILMRNVRNDFIEYDDYDIYPTVFLHPIGSCAADCTAW